MRPTARVIFVFNVNNMSSPPSRSLPHSPSDRSGIENVNSVEALQETLIRALRTLIMKNHPNEASIFTKLLLKLPDLRSLNNMHSEELLAFKVHP